MIELSAELAHPRRRDAEDPGNLARRFANGEGFGDTPGPHGQRLEPRGKVDACRRDFGRRRMFVFHDQLFPFTSRVVDLWGGVPDVLAPY